MRRPTCHRPIQGIMSSLSPLLFGSLLLSTLLFAGSTQAQTTLSMSSDYGSGTLMGERASEFSQKVAELSQGELKVDIRVDIRSSSHLQATRTGVIDIAGTLSGALANEMPFFGISTLPAIAYDLDEARRLYDAARPRYQELLEGQNQRLLFTLPWPPSGLWSQHPIDSASDLANQPMRTYDRNTQRIFLNLGAAPSVLTWNQLAPLLKEGNMQAALTSAKGGVSAELYRYMPYFTTLNYAMPLNVVHMNNDSFAALDENQQKTLLAAAKEIEDAGWAATEKVLSDAHAALEANGAHVITPAPSALHRDLETASKHVIESWKQKVTRNDRELLEEYLASRPQR